MMFVMRAVASSEEKLILKCICETNLPVKMLH